ncbi:hypothetical protein TSMEX_009194, partial [Taenia solium]
MNKLESFRVTIDCEHYTHVDAQRLDSISHFGRDSANTTYKVCVARGQRDAITFKTQTSYIYAVFKLRQSVSTTRVATKLRNGGLSGKSFGVTWVQTSLINWLCCRTLLELEEKMTTTFVSLLSHLQCLQTPLRAGVDASTMTEMEESGDEEEMEVNVR